MRDQLARLRTYCRENRESVAATLFYAAFVTGLALQSVPWALTIGGGTGFFIMIVWRILTQLVFKDADA